jgi:hypothetical protein
MTKLVRFRYRARGFGAWRALRASDLEATAKAATFQAECSGQARSISAAVRAGG